MRIIILALLLVNISCNTNSENATYDLNGIVLNDIEQEIPTIRKHIEEQFNDTIFQGNTTVEEYHRLTKNYAAFLDSVCNELIEPIDPDDRSDYSGSGMAKSKISNAYLFEGDSLSHKGKKFVQLMGEYRNEVLDMTSNEYLKDRINAVLYNADKKSRSGLTISYLRYHYQDVPLVTVLLQIKRKEYQVLLIESEYLYNKKIELMTENERQN